MRLVLVALLAALPTTAFAQDWDCGDAGNLPQQGMNYCAYQDWQTADRALNALWPQVKSWAKVTDENTREWQPQYAIAEESLLKAQRAWIDYRDGHCESEGMKYAGGSIQPLIVNSCKADLTRKRNEELVLLLEEG
ncbi:MAG: lysozyme inhibitor LprI family protein [Pseudomonadota bacterium]